MGEGPQPLAPQPVLLLEGVVTVTSGTVRGASVPGEVPLGVPDRTELGIPEGMFGSRIWADAAVDIRARAVAAIKALDMGAILLFAEDNDQDRCRVQMRAAHILARR